LVATLLQLHHRQADYGPSNKQWISTFAVVVTKTRQAGKTVTKGCSAGGLMTAENPAHGFGQQTNHTQPSKVQKVTAGRRRDRFRRVGAGEWKTAPLEAPNVAEEKRNGVSIQGRRPRPRSYPPWAGNYDIGIGKVVRLFPVAGDAHAGTWEPAACGGPDGNPPPPGWRPTIKKKTTQPREPDG